jgi:hypothetical protein
LIVDRMEGTSRKSPGVSWGMMIDPGIMISDYTVCAMRHARLNVED